MAICRCKSTSLANSSNLLFSGQKPLSAARTTGRGAWRGPYVSEYTFDDPWGNAYVMNVHYAPGGNYSGTVRHKVFVLSAGPDGQWQTPFADDTNRRPVAGSTASAWVRPSP